MPPSVARLLLLAYLLVPAAFTLGAAPVAETDLFARVTRAALEAFTPLDPARLSTQRVEFLANVVLFVPLGVLLPSALPRVPLTLLLAVPVLGSLGVEVAQLLVVPGRTPDAVDVLANSTGGALGLLLGADLLRLWHARRPSPR